MKIVINSNVHYRKPVSVLIKSMTDIGFQHFESIILVVSQSAADVPPRKVQLREIVPEAPDVEICVIEMTMNNFDYAGYHALHLYKDDPLVAAPAYLYIMDTCTVAQDFSDKYAALQVDKDVVTTCPAPHSNICAFGCDVVTNYGDNFGTPLTKDEAVAVEFERPVIKDGKVISGILSFGKFVKAGDRIGIENLDIYGTGHLRHRALYDFFGINKWILMFRTGDMTGYVTALAVAGAAHTPAAS